MSMMVGRYKLVPPTVTDGQAIELLVDENGRLASTATFSGAIGAGDNNIGNVDIVTLPALVAGTANIGDVDVLTVPADPFGVNADAASATGSISAKLRFIAATGIPITSIAAGSNNIGDVDVLSLPALPTGNNNIGDVDVASLPSIPSGSNEIGIVQAGGYRTNTATTNAATAQDTSADVILAANVNRRGFIIANAKQTVIKLSFGGTPTATAYHVPLKACTADDDGTGGVWVDNQWTGAVSAISSGASGGVVVTEFT